MYSALLCTFLHLMGFANLLKRSHLVWTQSIRQSCALKRPAYFNSTASMAGAAALHNCHCTASSSANPSFLFCKTLLNSPNAAIETQQPYNWPLHQLTSHLISSTSRAARKRCMKDSYTHLISEPLYPLSSDVPWTFFVLFKILFSFQCSPSNEKIDSLFVGSSLSICNPSKS